VQNEAISAQEIPESVVVLDTGWSRQDATWMLSLFGTAVGAGILFLPINAGMGGFWPLVLMVLMIGPMTYLAHRGLSRFLCSSAIADSDITQVVEEHFGIGAGKAITLLYFLAIYPIVLIYGVGITNTVDSFIINQLGVFTEVPRMLQNGAPALTDAGVQIIDKISAIPRWLLSAMLILCMMSVMVAGEKFMLSVTRILVYPLVAILAFMSLY
jgi:serine transporter